MTNIQADENAIKVSTCCVSNYYCTRKEKNVKLGILYMFLYKFVKLN